MRWFTSDIHDFHRNVILYCNRPYKDVNEMHEAIVSTWNSQVGKYDEVYITGDISLNDNRAMELMKKTNGVKILVAGNHDGAFWSEKKRAKYLQNGFHSVQRSLKITLKDGTPVLLNHFPYLNETTEAIDIRYKEHRPIDEGMILLCGHQHCRYVKSGKMIDLGWDNNLRLYSEQEVIDLIRDPRDYIPSRITEHYKRSNNHVPEEY